MEEQSVTYANALGELLGPFLMLMRSTYFFEAYVFMPLMTALSVLIFIHMRQAFKVNGTFDAPERSRLKKLWQAAYYSPCFLVTNSTAVAFKTLIVEETDYETPVSYIALVGPLHFYISSVALAYIWLIWRNRKQALDHMLCFYVQLGLIGGYYTGFYRLVHEPFDIFDVTSGVSGIFFLACFGFLNWDLIIRVLPLIKTQSTAKSEGI